jgi:hypothetical protein
MKLIVFALAAAAIASAQQPKKAPVSPHETISATLGGQKIEISYGRPYLKGRKAVGGTLVPYGQVWRLGADEATKLTTAANIKIGNMPVPAGSYALFALPDESGWKLIVNKTADQWGAFSYDKTQDLGAVDLHMGKTGAPVEQFTMTLESKGPKSAVLHLMWENTSADVPITVQ